MVALNGHFLIFVQELCDAVVEVEKSTKKQSTRKRGKGSRAAFAKLKVTRMDVIDKAIDAVESEVEDCIIVI
jgi:hypothetical protein